MGRTRRIEWSLCSKRRRSHSRHVPFSPGSSLEHAAVRVGRPARCLQDASGASRQPALRRGRQGCVASARDAQFVCVGARRCGGGGPAFLHRCRHPRWRSLTFRPLHARLGGRWKIPLSAGQPCRNAAPALLTCVFPAVPPRTRVSSWAGLRHPRRGCHRQFRAGRSVAPCLPPSFSQHLRSSRGLPG